MSFYKQRPRPAGENQRLISEDPRPRTLGFPPYLQNHAFKTQSPEGIPGNGVDVYVILNVSKKKEQTN